MIKETVNDCRFTDVLMADEYAGWTYGATKALFDYYEQLSEDLGEDIELDRVAIRCDWTEYDSALEAYTEYADGLAELYEAQGVDIPDCNTTTKEERDEEAEKLAREWLEERTQVLDVENIDITANEYRTIKSVLVMQF